MASISDISFTYDDLDEILCLILETDYPDITNAYYDGDLFLSLAEAQKRKRQWILKGLKFQKGSKVLDIGSGWGNLLNEIREEGGKGIGITLSPAQVKTCNNNGLEIYLKDWKDLTKEDFGVFDTIISIGAFEHFCSIEEYVNGEQEKIYSDFFKLCHSLLPNKGFLYLQTMTWGGHLPWGDDFPKTMAEINTYTDLSAPKMSNERVLALVRAFFPGSWVPKNLAQIKKAAQPYFELVSSSDGRLDYIQTITEWEKAWFKPRPGRTLAMLKLVPKFLLGRRNSRAWLYSIWEAAIREVFVRDYFGHQRIFFQKK